MPVTRLVHALLAALIFLLAPTSAAHADDITFSGQVTYRERIALPSHAELLVTLVTLPDQVTVVSALANIAKPGQVPLDFVLNVRSAVVADGGEYGLIAEIRSEGRTMFRSSAAVPVNPNTPDPVMIMVTFAPSPTHDPTPVEPPMTILPIEQANALLDTLWRVTSIGGDPVLSVTELTLGFATDLRAGGNGGCNNYFTEADFVTTDLSFGPIAGTRMICEPDVMAQEDHLFAALKGTAGYTLGDQTLQLLDAAGVTLIGMVRAR